MSLYEHHLWLWASGGERNSGEGCISTNNGRIDIFNGGDCWASSGHAPCMRGSMIKVVVALW